MRFSVIVTAAAAAAFVPLMAAASGPQMPADEFLGAVRCAAYETLPGFSRETPDLGARRARLNIEARNQSPEIVAQARAEILAIGERAAGVDGPVEAIVLRQERLAACAGPGEMVAGRAAERGDV